MSKVTVWTQNVPDFLKNRHLTACGLSCMPCHFFSTDVGLTGKEAVRLTTEGDLAYLCIH